MLPRQLMLTETRLSSQLSALVASRVNIKVVFARAYNQKAKGMAGMLDFLGLKLEGRHHSGIDDSRNIAKICQKLIADEFEIKDEKRSKRK